MLASPPDWRADGVTETRVVRSVEARYAHQVWTLDIDVERAELDDLATLEHVLVDRFHAAHERIFAVSEPGQRIEVVHGSARLIAEPHKPAADAVPVTDTNHAGPTTRSIHIESQGAVDAPVHTGGSLPAGSKVPGPALLVEPTTTIVVPPDCVLHVTASGNYLIEVP